MRRLSGRKIFWMAVFWVTYNFTLGIVLFHRTFMYALDTSLEDVFVFAFVWFVLAERHHE